MIAQVDSVQWPTLNYVNTPPIIKSLHINKNYTESVFTGKGALHPTSSIFAMELLSIRCFVLTLTDMPISFAICPPGPPSRDLPVFVQ